MVMAIWNGDVHGSSTAERIGAIGQKQVLANGSYKTSN